MAIDNQTPEIRFRGFTDPWEQRKLSDLAEIVGGGTPDTNNPAYWDGNIDWYAPAEMEGQRYATSSVRKITELGLQKSSAKILPAHRTVLFTSRAGIGKMAILQYPAATNQGFQSLILNDGAEPYFIYSMGNKIKEMAEGIASGSTFLEISGKMLGSLEVMLPELDEQKEIAEFFRRIDDLITLHQRKLEKTQNFKKAMLEKMFPKNGESVPEIRFAGFTDPWEQRKLSKTNTFISDGNYGEAYPKASDLTDSSKGIPFLTGGNLKNGKLSLEGASYITFEKHSKLTSGHLVEDDIVIAVRGSLGALGYVNSSNSGWNINSQLAILRTNKSELFGKFLIQYLLSWSGQNELLKRQTGSALKQLPLGAIKDIEVPIAPIAEQSAIGEFLAGLDNLITLHQRKLEKLQNIKKSMLEKMFV